MDLAETEEKRDGPGVGGVPLGRRLSTKVILLTILFVLIAEVLIFPPSVANYRLQWMEQRLATAAAVGSVLLETRATGVEPEVRNEILGATDALAIAIRDEGVSRLLVVSSMPPTVDDHVDLETVSTRQALEGAASTLFYGGDRILRITGKAGETGSEFELIVPDKHLRAAMLAYARNIALLSLLISVITAALVYAALHRLMISPIRRLRRAMLRFAEQPDDPARVIRPSARTDELGVAERELAGMQTELQTYLGEQKRLADLGLAVSKINHDMRNILASAQLMSDRLQHVKDPAVQAFAPKLVRTLDRAVSYTENVLAYGRAHEPPPARRRVLLRILVDDVYGLLGADPASGIDLVNDVHPEFEIDADSEQIFRVLSNLSRNAVQAMATETEASVLRRLSISADRRGSVSTILVTDTGPGLPKRARENLFAAFRGSARHGGTGLGLAIAFELVRAHGGTIDLVESTGGRTVFSISIPDQPIQLDAARSQVRRPA